MDEAPAASGSVRRTVLITLVVITVALSGAALIFWRDLLLLLFAGIVVATALQPACDLLAARLGLRESTAVVIVYAAVSVALAGLALWLAPQLWTQAVAIWDQLPGWYSSARDWLQASDQLTLQRIGRWLPGELPSVTLSNFAPADEAGTPGSPFGIVRTAFLTVFSILAVGILAFYWTLNRKLTLRSGLDLLPEHRRPFYQDLSETLFDKLGAYVRGQLILCAIVGIFSLIVYWFVGLPYALVLALVAGVLEAIPVFGPTLGAIPAIAVALSVSPEKAVMVLIGSMLIQTLENYLFVPRVMDRSVGISAVVTLLALVAFGALFGILGAVLAIPLAAIVQTLFDRLFLQADFKEQKVEISRDYTGAMRYQLLDLIQDVKRQQRNKEADIESTTTEAFNRIETLASDLDALLQEEGAVVSASAKQEMARSA